MNRTFISDLWDTIAGMRKIRHSPVSKTISDIQLTKMSWEILSGRGEASGNKLSHEFIHAYEEASLPTRITYLKSLAIEFSAEMPRLKAAITAFQHQNTIETLAELGSAAEPRRQELLRRLNHAQGGTAALVRMREDVLSEMKNHPELKAIDNDFSHLFNSWFNRGFLVLRKIDWSTPANILAKIIQYEAVHAIQSWEDLRNRLEPSDRRCFAFFHPQMADEPLVFVEVALTREIPHAIQPLLDINRSSIPANEATTAVFYSISNCQNGLRGVSFGNFLIKQVVEELKRDLPNLKTFVTLSPVPTFKTWLKSTHPSLYEQLGNEAPQIELQKELSNTANVYFLHAKNKENRPLDPVARFHLGNGAHLERININGDLSDNGLRQSAGIMVNYLYDLAAIEENHEAYANQGRVTTSKYFPKADQ